MFKPGQSGNPSGRPKADVTLKELAKAHTEEAINTLAAIMRNPKASCSARASTACALLDRGHGKPIQALELSQQSMTLTEYLRQLELPEPDNQETTYRSLNSLPAMASKSNLLDYSDIIDV